MSQGVRRHPQRGAEKPPLRPDCAQILADLPRGHELLPHVAAGHHAHPGEPFLWCINEGMGVSLTCQGAVDAADFYCLCAFLAMMLYWALLSDLAIFSMKISAYVLICSCVLSDVLLFFAALAAGIVAFGTSISALYLHSHAAGAHLWMESLAAMALRMYPRDKFQDLMQSSVASVFVCLFVFGVTIFMSNLLVAQLTQSFHDAHANMQGYARLKRAGITCLALDAVPKRKRVEFLQSLKLEEPLEFNEGDVGLPGGIQAGSACRLFFPQAGWQGVLEPAGENVVTEERASSASGAPLRQAHRGPERKKRRR
ncbi:unnamed protein product [Effrenium voratum]|nr:unnamed protein product [Effrenium voratum]